MLNGEHIKYQLIFIIGYSTPNWVKTSSDHIPKLSKIYSSLLLLYIIQMESCCTAIFPPAIIIKHYKVLLWSDLITAALETWSMFQRVCALFLSQK